MKPNRKKRALGVGFILVGLALGGCVTSRYADQTDEIVDLPKSYAEAALDVPQTDGSCCGWKSKQLTNAINRAFQKNFDLQAAWARLRQAKAVARRVRGNLFPVLSADASASRTRFSTGERSLSGGDQFPGGTGGPAGGPTGGVGTGRIGGGGGFDLGDGGTDEVSSYDLSLGASYEVDLWGRLRSQAKAASLDAKAARRDAEALAITLTAQIAENWFEVLAQRQRQGVLEKQIRISKAFLEVLEMRFGQGTSSGLDLDQQRQQVEAASGRLAIARANEAVASHRLAALLGELPESPVVATNLASLPSIPALPEPGVPGDLLQNRPDLKAAMERLKAADQRTAAAVTDRLPRITLSASLFSQEESVSSLLDEVLWSAVGSISQPIFEGGRRAAEVARTKAAGEERLYRYAQTLVTAVREVKDALVRSARQEEFIESLRKQRKSAKRVLRLARQRYQQGDVDYLRVLTAQQSLYEIQLSLLEAKRQQFSNRIQLCRAVGGQWPASLEPTSLAETES